MPDASSPSEDVSPPPSPDVADRDPPAGSASLSKIGFSLGLSLAVLLVIGYFTFDAAAFWKLMREMQPWPFVAAVLLTISRTFFGGWRLHFVSRGRLAFMEGIRGQLAVDFFSNITPSAIGGSPVATLYIAKDRGIKVGEATAFMLFAALLDQLWFAFSISVVLATSFVVDVIPPAIGDVGLWTFVVIFIGMLAWAALFAYATLFRPALLERLADRIFSFRYLSRFHDRVMQEMHTFAQQARTLRAQPPFFYLKGLLLTSGVWIGRYALVVFIVWSVFPVFDKLLVFLRTVAMTVSSLVLPTPGGSGGLEGLYALFIGPVIPESLVAPTLFAWRFLGYYIFIALGTYLFLHQIQQMRPAADPAAEDEGDAPSDQPQSIARPSVPSSSTE